MNTTRKRISMALGATAMVGTVAGIGFTRERGSGPVAAARAADAPHPAILIDDAPVGTDQTNPYVRVIDAGLAPGTRIVTNAMMRARPNDTTRPHMVNMTGAAKSTA